MGERERGRGRGVGKAATGDQPGQAPRPSCTEIENPSETQHYWRVEEEFISAIRGTEPVTLTPFSVGVHYMEFTEAVTRSAQTGQSIALRL